jgi:shikimate kinase/3-dehydroquinate synthase
MRPLFLVGFMATGKTTVGRLLADAVGRRFVDLDDVIAQREGTPVAELVARDEPAFRRAERAALQALVDEGDPGLVVATGGGAGADATNMELMRKAGVVVALTADLAESRRRATSSGGRRPLLERGDDAIAALLERRTATYRRAHAAVSTDDAEPDEVARHVRAVAVAAARVPAARLADTTFLALGERTYPVVVCSDELDGHLIASHLPPRTTRIAIVTDANVGAAWGAKTEAALKAVGLDATTITVPAGESSKSLATFEDVCGRLVAAGLDRKSAILALGGGVVGDLAGFVAATLYRGIPVIQLPTTLLAMVDSAIGGKTGVDLAGGKNLVGAFWQPRAVIACEPWLATLPERERRAAYGELWKYALLEGGDTWTAVANHSLPIAIRRAVAYKAWIVSRDERETRGERALLNLGHTIGHAIESAAGWQLLHGECVALGLVAAARVSAAIAGADPALEQRVVDALAATGLDADVDRWLTDDVLGRIGMDKKRTGDRIGFVAIRDVGRCEVIDVAVADLRRILRRAE